MDWKTDPLALAMKLDGTGDDDRTILLENLRRVQAENSDLKAELAELKARLGVNK